MLVLRRKAGEAIVLNGVITIHVLAVEGERVKLGISAPPEVVIVRSELLENQGQQLGSPGGMGMGAPAGMGGGMGGGMPTPMPREPRPYEGPRAPYQDNPRPYEGPRAPYEGPRAPYPGEPRPYEGPRAPYRSEESPRPYREPTRDPNRDPARDPGRDPLGSAPEDDGTRPRDTNPGLPNIPGAPGGPARYAPRARTPFGVYGEGDAPGRPGAEPWRYR